MQINEIYEYFAPILGRADFIAGLGIGWFLNGLVRRFIYRKIRKVF